MIFFVGSYTEYPIPGFGGTGLGIYTVRLNTDTGRLTILHTKKTRNPSYLTVSDDNQFLYCVTELSQSEFPKVRAYRIMDDFSLKFLNEQPISGGFPCHLVTHADSVLVACYSTGNVLQFPLDVHRKLLPSTNDYRHRGSSIHTERQDAPHAHQVVVHPNAKDIYVCDLGIDTIKAYYFEKDDLVPNKKKDFHVSKGGGPRHLVFDKNGGLAYVINELTGDVSVLQDKEGIFEHLNTYSALPDDYRGEPSGSAIRIHPNGRFLYAANRRLEAITIFGIGGDQLKLIDLQFTKGDEGREFNIAPNGKWLIACHQNSHDTVVYKIKKDGKLVETFRAHEVLSPVCVVFLN